MPLSEHVYCVAVTFKMIEQVEQWICTKFCIKLEHSSMETIRMIQKAFRDDEMSAVQIKMWHKWLKDGQEGVGSDPCFGRPASSRAPENAERVWAATNKDQWLTVRELEADLGIPKTSVSKILMQDLGVILHRILEMCLAKICSAAPATKAEETLCCSC